MALRKSQIYRDFHLKTDDTDAAKQPPGEKLQGRMYGSKYSQEPGGIRVEEMIFGVQMAHLSCTDDSEGRLEGSSPNTIAALEEIVGKEDARKPLSTLLKNHFDLDLNCWINESGMRHCRPVDTQGFIASNASTIVLSFRYSTSLLDWMTNVELASSEWEPDIDEAIGHAGCCSCYDGYFTKWFTSRGKPRVHTGFYNNFIQVIPMIRQHILGPLNDPTQTPKKIYIVGCSLGAALATMAFCFVLQEMEEKLANPDYTNHKVVNVTAGCPKCCDDLMRETVMARLRRLRPLDRAVEGRLVYNHDLVPHVPFGSRLVHLDKLVYITKEGEVIINPDMTPKGGFAELKETFNHFVHKTKPPSSPASTTIDDETKTAFELEVENTPEPIMNHMPYWYLTNLEKLKAKQDAGEV